MTAERRRAAFFDVDETLITAKSMLAFLAYWLAAGGDDGRAYRRTVDTLLALAGRGMSRELVNRAYYRQYAGVAATAVRAAGRAWYTDYRERPDAFVSAALRALQGHRAAGDHVVLVSGSFDACLAPLAEDLGADLVLCSDPLLAEDGTYTGETGTPMIGPAKARAVAKTIADFGLVAGDCFGYGDHSSDLPMLTALGHPVVVGSDRTLNAYAQERGWPMLPQTTGGRKGI